MTDTRERLLESACEVFAEQGFQDANVAEICEQAEANIAAINYHYGGKKKLYVAVLEAAAAWANEEFPIAISADDAPDPRDRIAHFIRAQFSRTFLSKRAALFPRLLVHEMSTPTFAHEEVFRELMRPNIAFVRGMLGDFMGPDIPEAKWHPCVMSIISLCAFPQFNPHARDRILQHTRATGQTVETLIVHTIRFALAGLTASKEALLAELSGEGGEKNLGECTECAACAGAHGPSVQEMRSDGAEMKE
jgi:TetR/AcrR family transcriptional regulator, regulator of cefoperazone and chloramphenicol sensitivity